MGRQFLQKKKPNIAYFSKTSDGGNQFGPPRYVIGGGGGVNNITTGRPEPVIDGVALVLQMLVVKYRNHDIIISFENTRDES